MRKQDKSLATDIECFAKHILENSTSRNTLRVVERAVEKWKKLNELLAYVDKRMSSFAKDELIPNSQFFQFVFDYAKERDTWLMPRVSPELNSLWYFVVSLWRNLQEDENALSPEDAYWLAAIDEIQGSTYPCNRLAVERIEAQDKKEEPN
jgi:hypothetical protein